MNHLKHSDDISKVILSKANNVSNQSNNNIQNGQSVLQEIRRRAATNYSNNFQVSFSNND